MTTCLPTIPCPAHHPHLPCPARGVSPPAPPPCPALPCPVCFTSRQPAQPAQPARPTTWWMRPHPPAPAPHALWAASAPWLPTWRQPTTTRWGGGVYYKCGPVGVGCGSGLWERAARTCGCFPTVDSGRQPPNASWRAGGRACGRRAGGQAGRPPLASRAGGLLLLWGAGGVKQGGAIHPGGTAAGSAFLSPCMCGYTLPGSSCNCGRAWA